MDSSFRWNDGLTGYASPPIFLFRFLIMNLIWLYLLGLARIITGDFSPATNARSNAQVFQQAFCEHKDLRISYPPPSFPRRRESILLFCFNRQDQDGFPPSRE
jgi:hypothetical protein